MSRTSVRKVGQLADLSRAEHASVLRSRMAELGGGAGDVAALQRDSPEVIRVVDALARALPGGGLARRAVTELSDCPALVVELISPATAQGGHVAVVG